MRLKDNSINHVELEIKINQAFGNCPQYIGKLVLNHNQQRVHKDTKGCHLKPSEYATTNKVLGTDRENSR